MQVTVMLPAYNEASDINSLLSRIGQALWDQQLDFKILVVDDGSQDETADLVRAQAQTWPIELIQHPKNMGLGAAIRTGLTAAMSGDGVVVTMDADNSHDPKLISLMLEQIEGGFDVVIASRFQPGAEVIGVPLHRVLLSEVASRIMRLLFPYKNARDYTCGYRVYRCSILRQLYDSYGNNFVIENGFACMFEILLKLRQIGARVAEVPMVLRYDLKTGASKMRIFRTIARYAVVSYRGLLPPPVKTSPK